MTDHTPAAQATKQETVLTDGDIRAITETFGGGLLGPIQFARAVETALLSKLRAPVVDERAAFEHAERASNLERDEEDDYMNPFVQSSWEGWQARAALASTPMPEGLAATALRTIAEYPVPEQDNMPAHNMRAVAVNALASAPVAGEAQPSDADISGTIRALESESRKARADDGEMGVRVTDVMIARAVLARYGHFPDGLMADMTPPATARDRWMYEQGRLAERDPRSHAAPQGSDAVRSLDAAADLLKLAAALGNRNWKWWDSCSFRRLTFEDGPDRRDGSALHGTVQASDGHPDVSMAPGVREFIEAASPKAIAALIAAYMAALSAQPEQS